MEIFNSRRIANIGAVAALYTVLTLACAPLAYGDIQFRVSEMLMLLCFFNKDYILSMTMGCFIVNLFSPMGFVDVGFGTLATLIAAVGMYAFRNKMNLFVASLFPVVSNGLIIGAELKFMCHLPFWMSAATVALGEFVCVSILGVIVVGNLAKRKKFMRLITSGADRKPELNGN